MRAYPEDSATTVVVSEGDVEVREGKVVRPVEAGAALFVGKGMAPRLASPDEREEASAWRNDNFTVTNRPLRDVLPQLRRWYNLDVKVPTPPSSPAGSPCAPHSTRRVRPSAGWSRVRVSTSTTWDKPWYSRTLRQTQNKEIQSISK